MPVEEFQNHVKSKNMYTGTWIIQTSRDQRKSLNYPKFELGKFICNGL
jgi:hypothetical protein